MKLSLLSPHIPSAESLPTSFVLINGYENSDTGAKGSVLSALDKKLLKNGIIPIIFTFL